jgi:formamidopyrimidine-DNA glycosylase
LPELPDVHHFKTYLDATALHQTVVRTSLRDARLLGGASAQLIARRLKGRPLSESRRHGKFLFARSGDAGWLVFHFGMTGELHYYHDAAVEPDGAKLVLDFRNGHHLAYINKRRLGQIDFTESPDQFVEDKALGPDAMGSDLDRATFIEHFRGRSGMLKPALMNQAIIAGLGNIYSDEILFQARLHPKTQADALNDGQLKTLYRTMRRVLRVACSKQADIDRLPGGYLLPRRAAGEACPKCRGSLRKITVSGRTAIFCPRCQR